MSLALIWSTIILGLLYGLLVLGVFLTFRILDYADLTVDGSLPLGAAITATLIFNGVNPFLATLAAIPLGALAGLVTGVLHTRFAITPLLSGILSMIGLYSINLRIMGRPNVPLLRHETIFDVLTGLGLSLRVSQTMIALAVIVVAVVGLYLFLNTELGQALRGTGDNEIMLRSLGVNTDRMKIMGLAISNALVALSGALIAQYQGFADINMGIGMIVIGLASVIIGEVVLGVKSILGRLCAVVVGSILYRLAIALVLQIGFIEYTDLKLFTALLVTIALISPEISKKFKPAPKLSLAEQKSGIAERVGN
ncbi:MAG: ABC transporter permease [Dethiobacteria bacterium]|jgi:putative ABC transport system permease protein|nr:ABC transporter permease [Bacillota bacterium]HOB29011.1 ABC transporter permease [Bacillota bacterium]HPZ41575.1 ABC transporter permease [Bacillota bacterium]HQD52468.1 ABC transporter permease [Bacillota bacterium]